MLEENREKYSSNWIKSLMRCSKVMDKVERMYPVKHWMLDLRAKYIYSKIRAIMRGEPLNKSNEYQMNELLLSKFLNDLFEKFGTDIEDQADLRNLIDSIFLKRKFVIIMQMVAFLVGFIIPFLFQLFYLKEEA